MSRAIRKYIGRAFERLQTWRSNQTHFIGVFIAPLTALGYWSKENNRYALRSLFMRSLNGIWLAVLIPFFTVFSAVSVYVNRQNDTTNAVLASVNLFEYFSFVLTAATLWLRRDRLQDAVVALEEMLLNGSRLPEQPAEILRRSKAMAEICVVLHILATSVFTLGGVASVCFGFATRTFLNNLWLPYDVRASPYFEVTWLAMFVTMHNGFYLLTVVYFFALLLLALAIGQFRLLNFNLRQLGQRATARVKRWSHEEFRVKRQAIKNNKRFVSADDAEATKFKPNTEAQNPGLISHYGRLERLSLFADNDYEERFGMCVRHHQSVLRFVNTILPALDPILLNHLNISITPTLITLALVIDESVPGMMLFVFSIPLLGCVFYTWLLCWLSAMITTESELVRDAVFGSDWVGSSAKFRQAMGIMISRSNQPTVIRVAGFIPLSLPTFYAMMKLIYSWYTSMSKVRANIT